MNDLIILWTARVAMGVALLRYFADLYASRAADPQLSKTTKTPVVSGAACIVWTAGCCIFYLHLLAAFSLKFDWSHFAACEDTRRQTQELIGWNSGAGIWFNYLFAVLWPIDVAVLWSQRRRQQSITTAAQRPQQQWLNRWQLTFQVFFLFMVINATLVFGSHWWWGIAILYGATLNTLRGRESL